MRIPEEETVTDSIVRVNSMLEIIPNHCDAATDAGERIHRLRKEQGELEFRLRSVVAELFEARVAMDVHLAIILQHHAESTV
jgi:hypothetical protein